jgi:hypothetical protein
VKYKALPNAIIKLIWVEVLIQELGVILQERPCLLWDNLGATYLLANHVFYAQTKHIKINYHFVRERVAAKLLDSRFISTKDKSFRWFYKKNSCLIFT